MQCVRRRISGVETDGWRRNSLSQQPTQPQPTRNTVQHTARSHAQQHHVTCVETCVMRHVCCARPPLTRGLGAANQWRIKNKRTVPSCWLYSPLALFSSLFSLLYFFSLSLIIIIIIIFAANFAFPSLRVVRRETDRRRLSTTTSARLHCLMRRRRGAGRGWP